MTTGEKIKVLREQKGMTQEELGAKLGVKNAAIHKYESGIVVNLKRTTIDKLCEILECSPAYLMGWDDEQKELLTQEDEELTEEEWAMVRLFRVAPPEIQAAALAVLKTAQPATKVQAMTNSEAETPEDEDRYILVAAQGGGLSRHKKAASDEEIQRVIDEMKLRGDFD